MSNLMQKNISSSHPFVQVQAVSQALSIARRKLQGADKLGKSNPELELLWTECCDCNSPVIASECVNSIITLVKEGVMDGNIVISTAVNYAASAKSAQWLIKLVGQLLELHVLDHMQSGASSYCSPYNLRSPPHPLISILRSKADSWNLVSYQVHYLLSQSLDHPRREEMFPVFIELLKPVILHILLNPSCSHEIILAKNHTFNHLFTLFESPKCSNIAHRKLSDEILFPCLCYENITEHNLSFHIQLIAMQLSNSSNFEEIFLKILKFCSSDSKACTPSKANAMNTLIRYVHNLETMTSFNLDMIIIGLSDILIDYPSDILQDVLALSEAILKTKSECSISPMAMYMMRVALLQLQLVLSIGSQIQKHSFSVTSLLRIIDQRAECWNSLSVVKTGNLNQNGMTCKWIAHLTALKSMFRVLNFEKHHAERWLKSVGTSLSNKCIKEDDSSSIAVVHCIALLHGLEPNSLSSESIPLVLNNIKLIAPIFPQLSFLFLPVLLYALQITNNPDIVQGICFLFPCLVGHPSSVSPVLNIIRSLAHDHSLKPFALRLMVDLWMIKDRCFPQLHRMMDSLGIDQMWEGQGTAEFDLLKTFAMNKICQERPHQYGSDMLKMITMIIRHSGSSKRDVVKTALAVNGLFHLCSNKILNLETMWKELGQTLLSQTNCIIIKKVLEVLSLIPEFEVTTLEYQKFKQDSLSWIWSKVLDGDKVIAGAALVCLSKYEQRDFTVGCLPSALQPERLEDEDDQTFSEKPVTGTSYKVLVKLNPACYGHLKTFYASLMKQELSDLPRDIHHRAMKSERRAVQPKPLQEIPHFILDMYIRNKNPGKRGSLAGALLLCHPSSTHKENQPSPAVIVSQARSFLEHLKALLKESPLDINYWQSVMWSAHGWKVFIRNCFLKMVQGRQADLRMQLQRVKDNDSEETERIQESMRTISSWCREEIMNALKNASKGNPVLQGNAVLALSGLINAVKHQHSSGQDDEEGTKARTEYLSPSHWMCKAMDTVLSIANKDHIPSGRIFSWCQYRAISSTGRLSTTQLGVICALHALPSIAEAALDKYSAKVEELLRFLFKQLKSSSDQHGDEDVKDLLFHCSITLGEVLGILFKNNVEDNAHNSLNAVISECFDLLCHNAGQVRSEGEEDLGSILGSSLAFASQLRYSSNQNVFKCTKQFMEKLLEILKNGDEKSPQYMYVLSSGVSWLFTAAYGSKLVNAEEAKEVVDVVLAIVEDRPENADLAESLGMLCNGLYLAGANEMTEVMDSLFNQWYKVISKDRMPTRRKLTALSGISGLIGANSNVSPQAFDLAMLSRPQYQSKLSAVIKHLSQFALKSTDAGVPTRSITILGHLFASFESTCQVLSSTVPLSYDYLPITSSLRFVYNILQEILNGGRVSCILELVLDCFAENAKHFKFPPVNWAVLLSQILSSSQETKIKDKAFLIAIHQCVDSPTCALLLSTWMANPKLSSLPSTSLMLLFENLEKIAKCQTDMTFANFLDASITMCMEEHSPQLIHAFLTGLKSALSVTKVLSQGIPDMLYDSVERIFLEMELKLTDRMHLKSTVLLAKCMEHLPDANAVVEKFESANSNDTELLKSLCIRCCCTSNGSHPLCMCIKTMELCGSRATTYKEALWLTVVCLRGVRNLKQSSQQMEWLQEITGKLKTILSADTIDVTLATFFFYVFVLTVTCWSYSDVLLGISNSLVDENIDFHEETRMIETDALLHLTIAFPRLLSISEWERTTQTVTDSLLYMQERFRSCKDTSLLYESCLNCLHSLRQTKFHQKPSTWSRIVSSLFKIT